MLKGPCHLEAYCYCCMGGGIIVRSLLFSSTLRIEPVMMMINDIFVIYDFCSFE